MKIRTFVKGRDDFGRTPISDTKAKFEVVTYEVPEVGDYLLYLYPDKGGYLLYRIEAITEKFTKDLPYIITGKALLLKLNEQPQDIFGAIHLEFQKFIHSAKKV